MACVRAGKLVCPSELGTGVKHATKPFSIFPEPDKSIGLLLWKMASLNQDDVCVLMLNKT